MKSSLGSLHPRSCERARNKFQQGSNKLGCDEGSCCSTNLYSAPLLGDTVMAHSLVKAPILNARIGKITGFQDGRVGVDFGPPHGRKLLLPANLHMLVDASGTWL